MFFVEDRLASKPDTFAIVVDSAPRGAFVYLDGAVLVDGDGRPLETPLRLSNRTVVPERKFSLEASPF